MSNVISSAPASMMLLGEHAVLRNHLAIVCAIDKRIEVKLSARSDRKIHINSNLGKLSSSLDHLSDEPRFKFVAACIKAFQSKLQTGFDLEIHSEFSHQVGLGSSAAVTVSCVTALDRWLNADQDFDLLKLFLKAREIIQKVQGLGSGADVAACVYGGTVLYRMHPFTLEILGINPPLSAVYSGHKTPTIEVVKWVNEYEKNHPEKAHAIFNQMNQSVLQAMNDIEQENWKKLGETLNLNHTYMKQLGLSTDLLDQIQQVLVQQTEVYGAKISGSGQGDCLIALGKLNNLYFPQNSYQGEQGVQQFDLKIATEGIRYAAT